MPVVSFWNVEDEALRCINSCDIAGAVSQELMQCSARRMPRCGLKEVNGYEDSGNSRTDEGN